MRPILTKRQRLAWATGGGSVFGLLLYPATGSSALASVILGTIAAIAIYAATAATRPGTSHAEDGPLVGDRDGPGDVGGADGD